MVGLIDIAGPTGRNTRPWAAVGPRNLDAVVLDDLISALASGAGCERIAEQRVLGTTLRRRRDE